MNESELEPDVGNGNGDNRREFRRKDDKRKHRLESVFRWTVGILMAAMLAVLAVLAVETAALLHTSNRLNGAIAGSCDRLQRVRDDLNINSWGDRLNSLQAAKNNGDIASVLEGVPQLPELAKIAHRFRDAADKFNSRAATAKYLPPTNCLQAVEDSATYKAPMAVPFSAVARCFHPPQNPAQVIDVQRIRPKVEKRCHI